MNTAGTQAAETAASRAATPAGDGNADDEFAAAQDLLAKWHSAATCLSRIPAGRLELALVCDVDPYHERALEVASLATTPLRLLPRLKNCHVRLCKVPNASLQQIAWEAVLQARRIAPPSYSSPRLSARPQATLLGLPRELRLRILEYTDLIAPAREVTWSRQDQGYLTLARKDYHDDHEARRFYHCWTSSSLSPSLLGCFCRRRHAAFSFACDCWAPPSPLFLVCRALYQDAQFAFFSGNRFIVHDYKASRCSALPSLYEFGNEDPERPEGPEVPDPTRYDYPSDRFAVSQFLREVVPAHCLAYLRFLELVFPFYFAETWPGEDHPAMRDWRATVNWLLDKVNAPALTLRLAGAEVTYVSPDPYHRVISMSEGTDIAKAHLNLIRPLKALGAIGLARFFANLPFPWAYTMDSSRRWDKTERIDAKKKEFKAGFERCVMGDRYKDQYANGKEEPEPSFWLVSFDWI
ncbi:hypothetical protein C8A05DRAFT_35078 [Staphylotrichum tortipilum]|uniref:F-box domain-containing protein n=1 Tax=Staphylotrichum tortipilum TaxID=2831512 RepID=A0AAN6RSK0_9PEZI|nr:hypothetical protein C8A05DRAFT_35078 [Staphylotrichum longicolle]